MSENESNQEKEIIVYDLVTCSKCNKSKRRRKIGKSPNGKRYYYQDDNGKAWRGKVCPECSKKAHTKYMREKRQGTFVPEKDDNSFIDSLFD